MTTTPSFDLDPLFVRALRLLHSKAKDSTEQLKQMLDDVLQQKSSGFAPLVKPQTSSSSSSTQIKAVESSIKSLSFTKKPSPKHLVEVDFLSMKKSNESKSKAEKRSLEKETPESPHESKKPRYESPKASPPQLKIDIKKEESDETDFSNTDAEDFITGLGLACVVCRTIEVSSGNQLVECQECHNLYHQECQKPPITDQEVNDPRLVWYCTKCAKTIKKLTTKTQKSGKMSPATTPKELVVNKPLKTETQTQQSVPQLFKRSEVKQPPVTTVPNTRSTNPGNKPTGLAGLAASLSGKGLSGKTTPPVGGKNLPLNSKSSMPNLMKSGSNNQPAMKRDLVFTNLSSGIKSGGNNGASTSRAASNPPKLTPINSGNGNSSKNNSATISADKRLQIMKKKAEKKLHEKRYNK